MLRQLPVERGWALLRPAVKRWWRWTVVVVPPEEHLDIREAEILAGSYHLCRLRLRGEPSSIGNGTFPIMVFSVARYLHHLRRRTPSPPQSGWTQQTSQTGHVLDPIPTSHTWRNPKELRKSPARPYISTEHEAQQPRTYTQSCNRTLRVSSQRTHPPLAPSRADLHHARLRCTQNVAHDPAGAH